MEGKCPDLPAGGDAPACIVLDRENESSKLWASSITLMKRHFLLLGCCLGFAAQLSSTRAQTTFSNPASLTAPNGTQASPQKASLYPSTIAVSALSGTISKLTVKLTGIS